MTGAAAAAGFCGKLPASADFVIRNLPLPAVEAWHGWLGEALAASRIALGEAWLEAYLYAPIWRCAVPAGAIGPGAFAGTVMPSVDRIGRYFPLSILIPLASPAALMGFMLAGEPWFEAAEALSLSALDDALAADELFGALARLPNVDPAPGPEAAASGRVAEPGTVLALDADAPFAALAPAHLKGGHSVWWTHGTERIAPALVFAAGLPRPEAFAALLTGGWADTGWRDDRSLLADGARPAW